MPGVQSECVGCQLFEGVHQPGIFLTVFWPDFQAGWAPFCSSSSQP